MGEKAKSRGSGLLLEGVVIVASILLAFAIDAWWDRFGESRDRDELLGSIRSDIVATRDVIERELKDTRDIAGRARAILDTMAGDRAPEAVRESMLSLGSVFVLGTWAPINDTYAEAVNSGRLQLIEDDALRVALFRYAAQVEELAEMYRDTTRAYYSQAEPFLIANTVYSEIGAAWWRESLVEAPFSTDFAALAESRELWNLLTLRLEIEISVEDRLKRLDTLTEELLALLPVTE